MALWASACGDKAKLQGKAGDCFLTTECEPGLVCIPIDPQEPNGKRTCDDDLTSVQVLADAGVPSDAAPAEGGPTDGGRRRDGASEAGEAGPLPDAGPQDAAPE